VLYQGRLDAITSSANPQRGIDEERYAIRQKMDELTQEKAQLENNLSFFAKLKMIIHYWLTLEKVLVMYSRKLTVVKRN